MEDGRKEENMIKKGTQGKRRMEMRKNKTETKVRENKEIKEDKWKGKVNYGKRNGNEGN